MLNPIIEKTDHLGLNFFYKKCGKDKDYKVTQGWGYDTGPQLERKPFKLQMQSERELVWRAYGYLKSRPPVFTSFSLDFEECATYSRNKVRKTSSSSS
jgi:hypothetical protein